MNALAKQTPVEQLPMAAPPSGNPMMEMLSEAIRAGQPIEVIREIKALVKEIKDDEARVAFDAAIAAAKDEIKPVVRTKDGHNGKYADLASIADAIDPILSRHGLNYRHKTSQAQAGLTVTCILSHKLGHREETSLTAGADTSGNKNSIQALGSTQQYLMRYTLVAAIGLSTAKDDDGKAAGIGEVLTEDQVLDLQALVEEFGADPKKLCQRLKVPYLDDLPQSRLKEAEAMIRSKGGRS